jgi:LmbE family N-acetylglucosaminyl deacetylase
MSDVSSPSTRLLCVYAHPDDEVFCSGGTIAKYAAEGIEVMVVSATKGDAGQIRDANVATRRTLGKVREQEFHESCRRLGAHHAVCLDYGDGTLKDIPLETLIEHVVKIIRQFRPTAVITFGPDGAYGHPDHVAIGEATTIACHLSGDPHQFPIQIVDGLEPHTPERLYHSHFPRSRMLMLDRLAHWLIASDKKPVKDIDFVRALLLFAEETTMLNYTSDRMDVNWYPAGFYIIEQGEVSHDLYLILSGTAKAVYEEDDGTLTLLAQLGPGTFFGEIGVAKQQRRKNHVIADEDVTCLILSMTEALNYGGRGSDAVITGGENRLNSQTVSDYLTETRDFTACIDVSSYVHQKVSAMAAHRTQYPISPDMFPLDMLTEMMGREYFVRILPRPDLEKSLFPGTDGAQ